MDDAPLADSTSGEQRRDGRWFRRIILIAITVAIIITAVAVPIALVSTGPQDSMGTTVMKSGGNGSLPGDGNVHSDKNGEDRNYGIRHSGGASGPQPDLYRSATRERERRAKLLKPRMDIVEALKKEVERRKIRFIDGDEYVCVDAGLTKTCMQGSEVKAINTAELYNFAKILESMATINTKFEVDVLILFKRYCAHYNVQYGDHEMFTRYLSMFRHDVIRMEEHNRDENRTYTMGYYTRLSEDSSELIPATDYSGLGDHPFKHTPLIFEAKDDPQRATFDWREGGYVSRMSGRDKSKTGWMLAAAAMYDTFIAIKEGRRVIHSAQQLWDCTADFDDAKGDLKTPLEYFKKKRLCAEAQYPFMGSKGNCLDYQCRGAPIVKSVVKINAQNAEEHLRLNGPFITIFDASPEFCDDYKDGIYDEDMSKDKRVAALVVGYGMDEDKKRYWIAQPAWNVGPDWGEDGFFRISDEKAKGMFDEAYGLSRVEAGPAASQSS